MNFNDKEKAIVCLIRHGQTNWNVEGRMQGREEVPLNENGIAQAKEAAKGMKTACDAIGLHFNKIISSPLERAVDTAKIIKDAIGCDYFGTDERWLERESLIFSELQALTELIRYLLLKPMVRGAPISLISISSYVLPALELAVILRRSPSKISLTWLLSEPAIFSSVTRAALSRAEISSPLSSSALYL